MFFCFFKKGGDYLESIISAVITGFLSLMGVCIATVESNKKFESKMETFKAVTDCKIDNLTEEIAKHNTIYDKVIHLEEQVKNITRDVEKMSK